MNLPETSVHLSKDGLLKVFPPSESRIEDELRHAPFPKGVID